MPPLSSSRVGGEDGGSSVYLLNCSVCKGEFSSRQKWMEHLTDDCHQRLVRECVQKDENIWRELSLMVFTIYDLTADWAWRIIQYFGRDPAVWVTDFLWWEERPRFAVIQFESRKKVEEVLRECESFTGDLIQIENQGIQVKGAFDLLELEWKAIIPSRNPAPMIPSKSFQAPVKQSEARISEPQNDKHQRISNSTVEDTGEDTEVNLGGDEEDDSINYVKLLFDIAEQRQWKPPSFSFKQVNTKHTCTIYLNGQVYNQQRYFGRAKNSTEAKQIAAKFCVKELKVINIKNQFKDKKFDKLYQQLSEIHEAIEIPSKECKQVEEIVGIFRNLLRKWIPSTQAIIFRNWYLKLRNSFAEKNDQLLVYIYAESNENGSFDWVPNRVIRQAINSPNSNNLFSTPESSFPIAEDPMETRLGCKILHNSSGTLFTVINIKKHIVETQLSKLVKYFCEFDPRIRPLLALARYWTLTNGIYFGEPEVATKIVHQCLPEPYSLDWMILTFLTHEKYVPSLRTILERPHRKISCLFSRTDVGFHADLEFSRKWKKKMDLEGGSKKKDFNFGVVQLFQSFLEFCCTQIFDKGNVIINPKDGEILKTSRFLEDRSNLETRLTEEEISVLEKLQKNSEGGMERSYCVDFRKWYWYMIHPLVPRWRCSVPRNSVETIVTTRKTNERLKNLIKLIEGEGGSEKAFEICGASLCEILKVDKEVPGIDPVPRGPSRKRRLDSGQVSEDPEKEPEEEPPRKKKIRKEPQPGPAPITFDLENLPPPPKGDGISLPHQLYSLLGESVGIPDNQFDKVLQAVNFLQKVFFHSNDPTCKVSLFRSWNLKLKQFQDDPENMPLVYVYNRKPCAETDSGFTLLPSGKIWSILKSREVKKKMRVLEGPTPKGKDPSMFKKGWTLECKGFGVDGNNEEETFKLCLFSSHKFLFEVEISGLLEYMCKFDERAYQLIKMAYLWMGLNNLTLGEAGTVGEEGSGSSAAALQWLVIFWMCQRKMVPSPREIQDRGNHKIMRDGGTKVDLGWEEDTDFLEKWRKGKKEVIKAGEDGVISLLHGFRKFLCFCGWLGNMSAGGNLVLNTRSGEWTGMKTFWNSIGKNPGNWAKKLNEEEVGILKAQLVNFKDQRIYMTHPLNLQWRFGLRNDIEFVLKLMKAGELRLKKYLNVRTSPNGEKTAEEMFNDLRNVFTLTDDDLKTDKQIKKIK